MSAFNDPRYLAAQGMLGTPMPIESDRPCAGCGYNLKGLFVGGVCPECGRPISVPKKRMLDDTLVDAPRAFLLRFAVAASAAFVVLCIVIGSRDHAPGHQLGVRFLRANRPEHDRRAPTAIPRHLTPSTVGVHVRRRRVVRRPSSSRRCRGRSAGSARVAAGEWFRLLACWGLQCLWLSRRLCCSARHALPSPGPRRADGWS